MNTLHSSRGVAAAVVLIALLLLSGGVYVLKPKILHGETRRAKASAEATAEVERTANAQGASAAASVTKIGEANAAAPASPSKDFIGREVPMALAKLPAPDPQALLEAERRRSAVMEGRAEEAARLYRDEAKRSAQLQSERDTAIAERRAVDGQLAEAAAVHRAAEQRQAIMVVIIALVIALWIYTKLFSISPASLGRIAADVRAGTPAIAAMNEHLAPWLHATVRKHAKLNTEPEDPDPAPGS